MFIYTEVFGAGSHGWLATTFLKGHSVSRIKSIHQAAPGAALLSHSDDLILPLQTITIISRCLWGLITATSPQLPCSDTHIIKCASRWPKPLFFCYAGWESLLLDQAHPRQPCTIWGMELLAQSEWSVLWGQSGEVLQVCCTSRNHPAHPHRSVFVYTRKFHWVFMFFITAKGPLVLTLRMFSCSYWLFTSEERVANVKSIRMMDYNQPLNSPSPSNRTQTSLALYQKVQLCFLVC